ncbi:MAG: amidohydrolase family protein [Armatimonadetes bacterium]|nr:amidohydrolase family protein [Armatimonadota bacterium]
MNNADLLARAGVPVAFQSDATTGARDLRLAAALAVRHGMDETAAFRALTEWPAHLAKLDHRVGLLAPGRDADVVVYSGSPLEFTSSVRKVMIDGKWVYEAP